MMSADDSQIESILKHYRPAGASPELKERIFGPKRRKTNWTRLAATATILVAAGLALTYHILSQPEKAANNQINPAQIERSILQAARAEQLLAVAHRFAESAVGREHAEEIYREIVNSFPKSDVSTQAQSRLKSLLERSTQQ